MPKPVEGGKVDPCSGRQRVVRGETDDQVLREAAERARAHGIPEATSELMERVKADVSDA